MKTERLTPNMFISMPDAIDQKIVVNGRTWSFDYCGYGGPLWLKKSGEPRKCQVPKKAVWDEFSKWLKDYIDKKNAARTEKAASVRE